MKLADLASALEGELVGDGSIEVDRPVHPSEAERPGDLALAMEPKLLAALAASPARAALVAAGAEPPEGRLAGYVVVPRARLALAGVSAAFEIPAHVSPGVHPSAVIEPGARLGEGVAIGPFVHVGPEAEIGEGCILHGHASVGARARLGARCRIHAGARIGDRVVLGEGVIVQFNAAIGGDGFSYVTPEPGSVETARATGRIAATNERILRINSLGTVILGDGVEVGACSAIDRATVSATRVGRDTKIDNLVTVGHNVVIGESCLLCGQVGIAGSATIGDRVVLAGKVGVADHVSIGDDTVVMARAGVTRNVPPRSLLYGMPAQPRERAFEELALIRRLKGLFRDVAALKEAVKPQDPKRGS